MLLITIIEAFLFTLPGPLFASVVMRVFRLITFPQASFIMLVAMHVSYIGISRSGKISFVQLCSPK